MIVGLENLLFETVNLTLSKTASAVIETESGRRSGLPHAMADRLDSGKSCCTCVNACKLAADDLYERTKACNEHINHDQRQPLREHSKNWLLPG